jgi:hypothetical protein
VSGDRRTTGAAAVNEGKQGRPEVAQRWETGHVEAFSDGVLVIGREGRLSISWLKLP